MISVTEKEFPVTRKIFCDRKTFPVTGSNFLSQKAIFCLSKKFPVTEKIFPVMERNISQ